MKRVASQIDILIMRIINYDSDMGSVDQGKTFEHAEIYEIAFEAAPNAMIMVNQHGKIVLVNKATENLFGYERGELIGQSVDMLVPETIRPEHPKLFASFFKDPKVRAMGAGRDLTGQRKDGRQVPVEIGLNPIQLDEGMLVMAAIVDITERKKAESLIKKKQKDLIDLNQDLEDFAYISSHDLKSPLRNIYQLSCILEEDVGELLPKESQQDLKTLKDRVVRMQDLVGGLLDYSKSHPLKSTRKRT